MWRAIAFAAAVFLVVPALSQTTTNTRRSAQTAKLSSLGKANTAALVVFATTSISCGDGSEGSCISKDEDIVSEVERIVYGIEAYRQRFARANAKVADIILEFKVMNAKMAYGSISLTVRDADTNQVLWSESRPVVVLDNDVTRLIAHLLKARGPINRGQMRSRARGIPA